MLEFDFSVEHVLMFMIAIFLLYHLVNSCGCIKDGFSGEVEGVCVGGACNQRKCEECSWWDPFGKHCAAGLECRHISNTGLCGGNDGWLCLPES